MKLSTKLLSEALGTGFLLMTVIGSGVMGEQLANGNTAIALLANSLATGCMLYVLITICAPVSGAHFNPLVTARSWWCGELSLINATCFVIAQTAGAISGVWLAHAMFELPIWQISTHERSGSGQWLAEIIAAFGLILLIGLSERFRRDQIAVLVACYITAAYWFTASTSFANPVVTMARMFSDTFAGITPFSAPAFVFAQIVGFLLAVLALNHFTTIASPVRVS